jgi:tricarballylate dehydrogenase
MFCRPVARGGHYNKGEGIDMALAIGAQGSGNFGLFHSEPVDPRSGLAEPAIFAFPYGILVDVEGRRFTDEAPGPVDAFYERITREIHHLPRGVAWFILDAKAQAIPNLRTSLRTDQPPVEAASIEELAALIEVPSENLVATVAAFNAACPTGTFDHSRPDGLATQGLEPRKSNWAQTLSDGPFHAYPIIAANVFSYGGLRTDEHARVLDTDGRAIEGLFAAGEITGLYYTNYTGSTSVLRGAVFGKIGGALAATEK